MRRKTIIAAMSAVFVGVFALGSSSAFAAEDFRDVEPNRWYYDSIKAVSEKGLIQGYPDGTFRPEQTVTYGDFLAMTMQTTGEEIPSTRKEGEHWAIDFYRYARNHKKQYLYWCNFAKEENSLGKPIPRNEMAAIICALLEEKIDHNSEYYALLNHAFKDIKREKYPIFQAYGSGILSGYPNQTFREQNYLTRAEAASVLWKLIEPEKRTAPTLEQLKELAPAGSSQTQDERILDILNHGPKPITFDPVTDTTINSHYELAMSVEKSREYLDIALSTLKFYGEKGDYYVSITLPELPKGYYFDLYGEVKRPGQVKEYSFQTANVFKNPGIKSSKERTSGGTLVKKLKDFPSLNTPWEASLMISVNTLDETTVGHDSVVYGIQRIYGMDKSEEEYYIQNLEFSKNGKYLDRFSVSIREWGNEDLSQSSKYSLDRHFIWK